MTLRPEAGRFVVLVEGEVPAPSLLARLAAHGEIEAEDERTLRVRPSAYRPGFRAERRVVLELGPLRRAPDGSVALDAVHREVGEAGIACPLTFVPRDGVWGITRAGAPGCRPRP